MPADWSSFIKNVSEKLSSRTLKNNDDLARFISDQYCLATVGKAQSPFGNTHLEGVRNVLYLGFKKAFDELTNSQSPTFEEKEKDPMYADLKEEVPTSSSSDFNTESEYLKWANSNENSPSFKYFQFFEDLTEYPKTEKEAVPFIARRIIFQYDGSSNFLKWLKTLPRGNFGSIGKLVYDEFLKVAKSPIDLKIGQEVEGTTSEGEIVSGKISKIVKVENETEYYISYKSSNVNSVTKKLKKETITVPVNSEQLKVKKDGIDLNKKIFQLEHADDPKKIPEYLTSKFIAKFTYDPSVDTNIKISNLLSVFENLINGKINNKVKIYGDNKSGEKKRYLDSLQNWIMSEAEAGKKLEESDQSEPTDPYEIMAKAIIDYWKSTLFKPLTSSPPVPPCTLSLPLGGTYLPVYYGNRKSLANFLRRAWNSGKSFKYPGTEKIASQTVSTALAFSFAKHLLEIKFVYQGGIPSPTGPVPMLGFVPAIF